MLHQSNAGPVAGPSTELELVNYGAGYAWLRPEPHPVRVVQYASAPLSPDDRVALTDLGRRALAVEACFGAWVNVAGRRTWTDVIALPAFAIIPVSMRSSRQGNNDGSDQRLR